MLNGGWDGVTDNRITWSRHVTLVAKPWWRGVVITRLIQSTKLLYAGPS